ncbi:MAG: Lrp/AsnC family transcriptional regulator [Candidatus Krumholzibacteriota bacterium]|nr:Lrp/AsnC family transcriptional regulator [Candidatus Krumholzibacteriota bacterium]
MKLDRIDFEIVEALQNNARISNKELAARVGLAPSSSLERVKRLQESGVLRGYHADVDPAAVGIELEALVSVRLKNHSRAMVDALRQRTLEFREVLAVYYLAGPIDFLVHVAVRDPLHLRDLVLEAFSTHDEVDRVETSLIFDHSRRWSLPRYEEEPTAR